MFSTRLRRYRYICHTYMAAHDDMDAMLRCAMMPPVTPLTPRCFPCRCLHLPFAMSFHLFRASAPRHAHVFSRISISMRSPCVFSALFAMLLRYYFATLALPSRFKSPFHRRPLFVAFFALASPPSITYEATSYAARLRPPLSMPLPPPPLYLFSSPSFITFYASRPEKHLPADAYATQMLLICQRARRAVAAATERYRHGSKATSTDIRVFIIVAPAHFRRSHAVIFMRFEIATLKAESGRFRVLLGS